MTTELDRFDVAIVGAGHAGAQAAIALRQNGYEGRIGLIGDEPDLPYERPPLSKDYLAGEKPFERILIRQEQYWDERSIIRLPSTRIESVHAKKHELIDAEGETIHYGQLIWAAGGEPRTLPCGSDIGLGGVHAIRTHADVQLLKKELDGAQHIAVIGGGYIGLEAAAVLTKLGKSVTIIEAEDRVLARVAGEPLSRFYEARHQQEGVTFRLSTKTAGLEGKHGRVRGVELSCGESLPCDLVIVGIGIIPNVEQLLACGAAGGNGVKVDAQCRTTLPDIFAIGDCALHANAYAYAEGTEIRLESVQNANDMAIVAARTITDKDASYDALPWFWSNQYDLRLQTAGLSSGADQMVMRGDPADGKFTLCYLRDEQLIAVDAVGRPADFVQAQKLIRGRVTPDPAQLADITVPLKALLPL